MLLKEVLCRVGKMPVAGELLWGLGEHVHLLPQRHIRKIGESIQGAKSSKCTAHARIK